MTLEELKAEAKKHGYSLVKAYERKVPLEPCPICHKKPHIEKLLIPYMCSIKRYVCACGGAKSELKDYFTTYDKVDYKYLLTLTAGESLLHNVSYYEVVFTSGQKDKILREGWNEAVDQLVANYNIKED